MSDDDDEDYFMSDDDDEDYFMSDDDDDYWSTQGDNDDFMSDDDNEDEEYPFPVHAASEAAIAALEAAEALADDCCPVCLQDGGEAPVPEPAARPWSRVAPCGHRFHATCVEKWLRVKLSCPRVPVPGCGPSCTHRRAPP
ncbi:uncharacterized transcriptional regulatory protein TBS1-like [Miscanthus floridulus]|uniref:uncharacterized transcriptional regulatory protein TBS1-like n=1 Tax=Miscanthus floridulus TaxID=154761 RepID=UPI00345A4487